MSSLWNCIGGRWTEYPIVHRTTKRLYIRRHAGKPGQYSLDRAALEKDGCVVHHQSRQVFYPEAGGAKGQATET